VFIYESYREYKTGVPLFGPLCILNPQLPNRRPRDQSLISRTLTEWHAKLLQLLNSAHRVFLSDAVLIIMTAHAENI